MTNAEVMQLLPQIKTAAEYIAKSTNNCCDPDDLQQHAVLCLLTFPNVAKYPLVTVVSCMRDYCRMCGYRSRSKRLQRVSSKALYGIADTPDKDYTADWEGVPLSDMERDVVQLYCEEGWPKYKIAQLYNCSDMHIVRTLQRAAKKAAEAWGDDRVESQEK